MLLACGAQGWDWTARFHHTWTQDSHLSGQRHVEAANREPQLGAAGAEAGGTTARVGTRGGVVVLGGPNSRLSVQMLMSHIANIEEIIIADIAIAGLRKFVTHFLHLGYNNGQWSRRRLGSCLMSYGTTCYA